jgi:lipopolysaccharide/colanic/teichoic acid biosynthesis glycosyltransferase
VHIAFFNRSYYPDTAATGQLLTDLCEDLARDHGCRVSVITGPPLEPSAATSRHGFGLVRREAHRGVEIHRVRGTRYDKRRFAGRAANYLSYFFSACWAGLRIDRPDVVVALTDPPIIGLAAWLAGRRARAPLVMSYRDLFPEVTVLLEDFHSDAINGALQRVNRFLCRRAARIVALGETMRDRLVQDKGAPPSRTVVIPDWADTTAITPGTKPNAFSETHGLSETFVVMHSGNVGLSQQLESLVDAAALVQDLPDVRVVFVGEGVKKKDLMARAAALRLANVMFLPYTPRERLSEAFATADLFVISLRRGMAGYIVPSKLYGILAAGRPFVAAVEDDCEVARLARRDDCGRVIAPGDAVALAGQIRAFHGDRALARACGQRARSMSEAFARPAQVAKYMEVFRTVAEADRPPRRLHRVAKRLFDAGLAGAGLLISLPIWAAIAAAVKWEDGGPVFFRQTRVGRDGRRFVVLKFRSMVPDAEATVGPRQAASGDPRITRVGRWLRATAMDELPQLLSIFKGDMSFVGPRALRPGEIEIEGDGRPVRLEDVPGFAERTSVTPGLTGVAQIYARRDLPRRHKFRYDRVYLRSQSFGLDMRLIALSFWITFRGTWEARGRKF